MNRRSTESMEPADEDGKPTAQEAPVVGDVVAAKDPQFRDSATMSLASGLSGGQDTKVRRKKNKEKEPDSKPKNGSPTVDITLVTTRKPNPKAVGRLAGQRAIRSLMEAFEKVRQLCSWARDICASVPGSHSDTEALDGLVLSLISEACKRAGQQILDDVRAAYYSVGLVECCDVFPVASHGELASSKEPRTGKRKRKWEPVEMSSKRARRER